MIILKYYFYFSFLIGAFIALVAGFVAFYSNRKSLVHILWFITNVSSAIWSVGYFLIISAGSKSAALYSSWLLHGAAILLATFYFHFVLVFANKVQEKKHYLYLAYASALFLLIINPTPYFVRDVVPRFIFNYTPLGGPLFFLFALHFWCIAVYAAKILYVEMKKNTGTLAQQYKHILLADVGFIGGGSTFFFTFNINLPPFTIIMYPLYPIIVTYAIVKHRLFNAKIIATELLVFSIWIFLLARLILSGAWQDKFIDGTLLIFVIFVGILLIRSVWKEVRQREEIEKLANRLSDFVSFVTHELRTPVTKFKGALSNMIDESYGKIDNEKVKDILFKLQVIAHEMGQNIEVFLAMNKIEVQKLEISLKPVDLNDLFELEMDELQPLVREKKIVLEFRSAKPLPLVSADEFQIKHVLDNLVNNAIKYSLNGGRISVYFEIPDNKKEVITVVEDNGIGIEKASLPDLFNKYERGSAATRKFAEGTGLGLFLSKTIINMHKGRIWAESEGKNKGSKFKFALPIVAPR